MIEASDSRKIAELNQELGYQTSKTLIDRQLKIIQSKKDHYAFVAINNNEIVGFIHGFNSVRLTTDTFVEIGALVVKEKSRNKGIGRALVNYLEIHVKNIENIRVRCDLRRKAAHDFYSALNYIEKKDQKIFERKLHTTKA